MIKNLLKLILLTMTILFLILVFTYYLSDKNIDLIKKNRKIDPFKYKISLVNSKDRISISLNYGRIKNEN